MIQARVMADIGTRTTVRLIGAAGDHGDVTLKTSEIQTVRLTQLRGSVAIEIVVRNRVYHVALSRLSPGNVPFLAGGSGQIIAKAAWNYLLLKNDGSSGAHNPQFVADVIKATVAKLGELPH